jgi:hypothetical protein
MFQPAPRLAVVACVEGAVVAQGNGAAVPLGAGSFCVLPADLTGLAIDAEEGARFLIVEAGR